MVITISSVYSVSNDDASVVHLESHEDYGPAKNLANSVPKFSGTSEHADFDVFQEAFIEKAQLIPKDAKRSKIFIQLLLERVLEPARLLLIGKTIEQPNDILDILSSTYGVPADLEDCYTEIDTADKEWNETIGDFLCRLNRLVKKGVKIATEVYGIEHKKTYKEKLNTKAFDQFMQFFDFGIISDVLEGKQVGTVKQVLKILASECPRILDALLYYDESDDSNNIFGYYNHQHEDTSSTETNSQSGEDEDCSPPNPSHDQHIHSDCELPPNDSSQHQSQSVDTSKSPIMVEILQQLSKISSDLQNIKDVLNNVLPELSTRFAKSNSASSTQAFQSSHHPQRGSYASQSYQSDEESCGKDNTREKSSSRSDEKYGAGQHNRNKTKGRQNYYKKRSSRH